jgi:hypothetical protein
MTLTYHARLMLMDHSKGTTSAMIQTAMKAEIMELRKLVRAQEKRHTRAMDTQRHVLRREINKRTRERDDARAKAKEWRDYATKYQKLLTQKESNH